MYRNKMSKLFNVYEVGRISYKLIGILTHNHYNL